MNDIIDRDKFDDNSKESKRKRGYISRLVSFLFIIVIAETT